MRVKIKQLFLLLIFSLVLVFCFSDLSYAEEVSNPPSGVNVTVPSSININFNSDGTYTTSQFGINNQSLVPITINNFNIISKNNWTLVPSGSDILKNSREMSLIINDYNLKVGSNSVSIEVLEQENKDLPIIVEMGAWTQDIGESAFLLGILYDIGKEDFTLSFDSNGGTDVDYISAKNEDCIILPSATRVGYTFNGWKDNNGATYTPGSEFIMPIGGSNLVAQWTANTDTKYIINHYQMDLNGTTYSLSDTEYKIGTSDSSLTVSSFKKGYTGFTYITTIVDSDIVTSTTVESDGSRVIDLYYSRNQYRLDLNSFLDSVIPDTHLNYGLFGVYVNGSKVASSVEDYCVDNLFYGSSYEFKLISTKVGRVFDKALTGSFNINGVSYTGNPLSGVAFGNTTVYTNFTTINSDKVSDGAVPNDSEIEILTDEDFITNELYEENFELYYNGTS